MSGDKKKREFSKGSRSGGNNSKEAPATMAKGEKPKVDDD